VLFLAWANLIITLLITAASVAASYFLARSKKGPEAQFPDEKPTTINTRGSWIPYFIGTRKLAPVVGAAGKRVNYIGSLSGGIDVPLAKENAWHMLCVGPAFALTKIWNDGKVIFDQRITSTSHPSGTEIDLGSAQAGGEGRFRIFWGEENQPVNTVLGVNLIPGLPAIKASRWPFLCYVFWLGHQLTEGFVWPSMEYEIEVRPLNDPVLSGFPVWLDQTTAGGASFPTGTVQAGNNGFITVSGDQTSIFQPTTPFIVRDNPTLGFDTPLTVYYSTFNQSFFDPQLVSKDLNNWTTVGGSVQIAPQPPPAVGTAYRIGSIGAPVAFEFVAGLYVATGQAQRFVVQMNALTLANLSDNFVLGFKETVGGQQNTLLNFTFVANVPFLADTPGTGVSVDIAPLGGNWHQITITFLSTAVEAGQARTVSIETAETNAFLNVFNPLLEEAEGTTVFAQEPVPVLSSNIGTIEVQNIESFDGANAASIVNQILFQEWPSGINCDQSLFDLTSLETIGVALNSAAERINSHLLLENGETVEAALVQIFSDAGILFIWDVNDGKYKFRLYREPGTFGTEVFTLSSDIVMHPLPEIETVHEDQKALWNRTTFTFIDRQRNFRENTITVDDDGNMARLGHQQTKSTHLYATFDFPTAAKIAERRAQEDLVSHVRFSVKVSRAARKIPCGSSIQIPDLPLDLFLRVVQIEIDTESEQTTLHCLLDLYGVVASSFQSPQGLGLFSGQSQVQPDLQVGILEEPRYLSNDLIMRVIVPRIRSSVSIQGAGLNLSDDGLFFTEEAADSAIHAGGILIDAMEATRTDGAFGDSSQETGPTFTFVGIDQQDMEDLTTVPELWRKGRQWALIGQEICYVRRIEAVTAQTYRMIGLLRARLGTQKVVHAPGEEVFIFQREELPRVSSNLLAAGATLSVKTSPFAGNVVDLSLVTAETLVLTGEALRPMRPVNLHSASQSYSWVDGDALDLVWSYRSSQSPKTGAGLQDAGAATSPSAIQGTFRLDFHRDAGGGAPGSLGTSVTGLAGTSYTFTAADISTFFLGLNSIVVGITNVGGGLSSDTFYKQFSRVF